jgi:Ca2+-binding EF-hand superfamily protein
MIQEARLRIEHNKQRHRLKQLLATAADGGASVKTQDLMLACELAKMPMDEEAVINSPFAVERDHRGSPKSVAWKAFHHQLPYPHPKGPGAFGELPPTRNQLRRSQVIALPAATGAPAAAQAVSVDANGQPVATDEEVFLHWSTLKRLVDTRFSEMRRAFRLIDEDSSGTCDASELKFMLNAMFNLSIPDHVMDRIIKLADYDGDGVINFAEFARIMTAEDVLKLKKTLVADVSAWGSVNPEKALEVDYGALAKQNAKMAAGGYTGGSHHVKLRRTGPGIGALRRAHETYKKAILARFKSIKDAFLVIDADGSGLIRRAELRRFLRGLSRTIPDRVISALIDFCDSDGDAKTLNMQEFVDMMSADTLGADGFDPSAPVA